MEARYPSWSNVDSFAATQEASARKEALQRKQLFMEFMVLHNEPLDPATVLHLG